MIRDLSLVLLFVSSFSFASEQYLVKFRSAQDISRSVFVERHGGLLDEVSREGNLFKWTVEDSVDVKRFYDAEVEYVQKNFTVTLFESPSLTENRAELLKAALRAPGLPGGAAPTDNPAIQNPTIQAEGSDPLLNKAWGMVTIGANLLWSKTQGGKNIVVAVTDTGIDYNHPDLIQNVWRNKAEIADNGIDDDKNGYIDDVVGWDFYSNDNKPYDFTMSMMDILLKGGNPGHGTHVSGVVGARWNNGQGTVGVAPFVKLMGLRFISEQGKGDSAGAIKAIDYAVANGARIINASWGSEGEEEGDNALREAITRAETKGVLFIAAAGNGRVNQGAGKAVGYDNDTDPKPSYPASYPHKNIIAVAATDSNDKLAEFSNFGATKVLIGAPGVKILSTTPGGQYQDTVIDLGPMMKATWDGTSMASPFVAGSLAVLWSEHPEYSAADAKRELLAMANPVSSLSGKVATGGRLDLRKLVH